MNPAHYESISMTWASLRNNAIMMHDENISCRDGMGYSNSFLPLLQRLNVHKEVFCFISFMTADLDFAPKKYTVQDL